jgi:hypothetical protein
MIKYSNFGKTTWKWNFDLMGSVGYNVLGALECTLINIDLVQTVSDWSMDEMERFSYRFCNNANLLKTSSRVGFMEVSDNEFDDFLNKLKTR